MTTFAQMAREASRSAQALLEIGDARGAINRAYYAVFNAARAALNWREAGLGDAKKHATTIRRFSQHLVRDGTFDARFARILTRTFDARTVADFENDAVEPEVAREIVDAAREFVHEIDRVFGDSEC